MWTQIIKTNQFQGQRSSLASTTKHQNNLTVKKIKLPKTRCHNPNFKLTTKARIYEGVGQE